MRIPIEKKSYLVVDDFGDMRSMLRSMLNMFGVSRIDTANDGRDAVKRMEKAKYDVVLCDYNLGPGKDGQQVLEEARQRQLISVGTVFVMITAENTREMVMGAIEYEPDSYLSKPFTKDLLRNRLEKLLAKKLDLEPIERAVELRNYAGAVQLLDQRIAKRPKNLAELTRLKAELCVKSGALDKAAAIYERILAVREIPWARLGSGQILFERRQFAEAREVFQDLINRNPDYVVAYDWLARAHDALQDPLAAQEILDHAVALSPKAVLRQQALGDLAMRNKDHVAAERAYGNAVTRGKHSVYKSPAVYAKLVEAQLSNDEHKDKKTSLAVVQQMEREFGRDSEAQLYTAMSEAAVQQSLGNDELARQQMEKAAQLYDRMGVHGKPQLTLALAKTAARVGDREQAEQLFQKAVRNNHEDDAFLRDAAAAAVDFGLEEDPGALIESIKKEIVDLNNRGVKLAGSGKLEQAIGLFEEAAEGMSGNRVINLNAAKVLIMLMERKGVDADTLGKARRYLERTRKLDPENTALAKVQEKFQKLINGHTL
jgi:CheY-like chemotaxis protein